MSGKFHTTSSHLFNNENEEHIPDWMSNIEFDIKEKESIHIDFKPKGIFADKNPIYRDDKIGTPREANINFNSTKLVTDAKISLARFLSGKYYKVEADVNNQYVVLNVFIDKVAADFRFIYKVNGNKLQSDRVFNVKVEEEWLEYPFSVAGLEECLEDIKSNKISSPKKVESIGKYSIISREEVIRRYNGKLREATDRINELLNEGSLVGVSSNSYASFYDMDYLFPVEERNIDISKTPEFDFVPNKEHVATKENKTAQMLTISASKFLSQLFNDYIIKNSIRDDNELLVEADVLTSNNICKSVHFCFGIENEKIGCLKIVELDDERMTIEQFFNKLNMNSNVLNSYLSDNKTSKRIYKGIVLTRNNITSKLDKIVKLSTIDKIIDNWVNRKLITPVNSTTYTTEKSFEELLSNISAKIISDEELDEIQKLSNKSSMYKTDRQNVKDTGVREYDIIDTPHQLRIANLSNYLTKDFKNFKLGKLESSNVKLTKFNKDNTNKKLDSFYTNLIFVNPNTGVRNNLNLVVGFDKSKVKVVLAKINNKYVTLDSVMSKFKGNNVLSSYLQDKKGNLKSGSIVISSKSIIDKLSSFVKLEDINDIVLDWHNKGLISNIGGDLYASDYSFEELLDKSDIDMLSKKDQDEILLAKMYFGERLNVDRQLVKDTGVRQAQEFVSDDTLLNSANVFLSKIFKQFETLDFKINGDQIDYHIKLFDEDTGIWTSININMVRDGNKILDCYANIDGNKVSIDNVKKAFVLNESLNKYLELNPNKKVSAPMIMTFNRLKDNILKISNASLNEIEDVVNSWHKLGKINKIGSNVIASKFTFEQLISMSNIKPLDDEEFKNRIIKSGRERNLIITSSHIKDNDTRQMLDLWSPEKMVLHAKIHLNKIFQDYDVLDAKVNNDSYEVIFRAVNPSTGIREKFNCKFAMVNNKPSNLISISSKGNNSLELNSFLEQHKAVKRSYKNIISKTQLRNQLSVVIGNVEKVVNHLVTNGILNPINNDSFASNYSMTEIVNHLVKFNKTDIEQAKININLAKRKDDAIIITDKRVMDNDTRVLNYDKELSEKLLLARNNMIKIANKAYSDKFITNKKLNEIVSILNNATSERELNEAWKELNKYFN